MLPIVIVDNLVSEFISKIENNAFAIADASNFITCMNKGSGGFNFIKGSFVERKVAEATGGEWIGDGTHADVDYHGLSIEVKSNKATSNTVSVPMTNSATVRHSKELYLFVLQKETETIVMLFDNSIEDHFVEGGREQEVCKIDLKNGTVKDTDIEPLLDLSIPNEDVDPDVKGAKSYFENEAYAILCELQQILVSPCVATT
jgi:hypothetical protein